MSSLSLANCHLSHIDGEVVLSLPGVLNLWGIEAYRAPDFNDHYHYKNVHGDLAIACDYVGRFSSLKDQRPYLCELRLESKTWLAPIGDMIVQDFVFAGAMVDLYDCFERCRNQSELQERIVNTPTLSNYVTTFLNWVELSAQTHGPHHFYNGPKWGAIPLSQRRFPVSFSSPLTEGS